MKIGVVGSMQFTEKMLELCDELERLYYKTEIIAMKPIVINGDLTKIA